MQLGLFDPAALNSTVLSKFGAKEFGTIEGKQLSREAAAQSLTLLRNGDVSSSSKPLPLLKMHGLKLAVLGPHANDSLGILGTHVKDAGCPPKPSALTRQRESESESESERKSSGGRLSNQPKVDTYCIPTIAQALGTKMVS